jgi:hypothetical protein
MAPFATLVGASVWPWVGVEVLFVGLFLLTTTLWRRAQAGTTAPEIVARYRKGMFGCGFWVILVATRLVFHAY